MSRAGTSITVYGVYLFILSVTLFAIPDVTANLIGMPPHKDVWLYVTAMTVFFLGGYYIAAARSEATAFFQLSVVFRYSVPFFFAAFVLLGLTKINILLFTPPDIIFATWTLIALRSASAAKKA